MGPQKNICSQSWATLPSASLCQADSISSPDLRKSRDTVPGEKTPTSSRSGVGGNFPCCCHKHSHLSNEFTGQHAWKWNTNMMIFTTFFFIFAIKMTLMKPSQSKQTKSLGKQAMWVNKKNLCCFASKSQQSKCFNLWIIDFSFFSLKHNFKCYTCLGQILIFLFQTFPFHSVYNCLCLLFPFSLLLMDDPAHLQ